MRPVAGALEEAERGVGILISAFHFAATLKVDQAAKSAESKVEHFRIGLLRVLYKKIQIRYNSYNTRPTLL